jgi:hypothetical protein
MGQGESEFGYLMALQSGRIWALGGASFNSSMRRIVSAYSVGFSSPSSTLIADSILRLI